LITGLHSQVPLNISFSLWNLKYLIGCWFNIFIKFRDND
jgi:hypothetical protein